MSASLKDLIRQKGIRQKSIADELGLSEARLSQVVNGRIDIPVRCVSRLADLLGVPDRTILSLGVRQNDA
jgi:transcriptional regulator with XRE-family HTH domain